MKQVAQTQSMSEARATLREASTSLRKGPFGSTGACGTLQDQLTAGSKRHEAALFGQVDTEWM